MKKVPKSSHAPEDEETVHRKELERVHERIRSLETRVHDLTLQMTTVCMLLMWLKLAVVQL